MEKKLVSVVMGSASDMPVMEEAIKMLKELKIGFEVMVTSAHRSPERTSLYARSASGQGIEVIIAGAGHAAHLAGVIASNTCLPIIGVPIDSSSLNGLDALLSTVQMPPGVPVATMAIGKAGAKNAALFAAQILANKYSEIKKEIEDYRKRLLAEVEEKSKKIEKEYE
ncbi:MAG TPA: 5-(carboxyamino)imidazole ribonucleotide mutase [Thermodesulfobacteriota bacterium]|nr:5-(carboxyamino)imidazole ribonucleotide mutase [Thermodesulfobacteriota bacterium]